MGSRNPETKAKAKGNKVLKGKEAIQEDRKAKKVAKAEKRAQKEAKAKATAEAKKAPGVKKDKYGPKRVVNEAKKKQKLKNRADKLEKRAAALLIEAKKAAAQYQALLDAEKNAAESKSEESDDENMEDADVNENDSSSDSESTSDSDSSSESDASETSDASENNGGAPVEQQPTEVPADVPADEIVMKHRRLSNAGSERSRISAADVPAAAEEELEKPKKEKKDKKGKKEKKVRVVAPEEVKEEAVESESEDEEPKVSEKKAKKDKKEKKDKKAEKKRKRAAESESEPKSKTKESEEPAAQAEKWQVDDLEGGSARQAKFLRLLGGKKAGATAPATHGSKGTSDSTKAEADIQRQFEAGMKMKNEGGSKRRGLGA